MGSNNSPDLSESWFKGKNILLKIAKYLLQGIIMFVAFIGFEWYITIVFINGTFGNYIPFMSYILIACLFLVFILVGALNRFVSLKLWNINASSHWVFLMGQGIVVVVLMLFTLIAFANFYVNGFSTLILGFTLDNIPFLYLGFTIPVIGFLSKFLITIGTQSEQNRFAEEIIENSNI